MSLSQHDDKSFCIQIFNLVEVRRFKYQVQYGSVHILGNVEKKFWNDSIVIKLLHSLSNDSWLECAEEV